MRRIRKAKIIATLGPSASDLKTIKKLFYSGADVFRLNFSHDVASTHIKRFKEIRNLEKKVGRPIGILMDLQGPKLRVGKFENGPIFLKNGKKLRYPMCYYLDIILKFKACFYINNVILLMEGREGNYLANSVRSEKKQL